MQFSQFLCLRYIGHLDTFHKLSNENSKKVKKYKAVKKYNLYASSGQSSKSFLVGDGHGQVNGNKTFNPTTCKSA